MTAETKVATVGTTISNFLNFPRTKTFLEENLQEHRGEFVSNLIAMCEADEKLAACNPDTLMKCAMNATSLNLPLNKNLGFAWIIPYKGVPSFQIGYKGIIQLAIRTGAYQFLNTCEIREGEINRNKITGEIKFNGEKPDNKVVGYLAYLKLLTGFSASLFMSVDKMEKFALKFSKKYQADKKYHTCNSAWSDEDNRIKMAYKTVLKGLLNTYGLLTIEIAQALNSDNEMEDFGSVEEIPTQKDTPANNNPEKIEI